MKQFHDWLEFVGTALLIAAVIIALFYFDYQAYRQRFPDADPWTYLFK